MSQYSPSHTPARLSGSALSGLQDADASDKSKSQRAGVTLIYNC